MVSQRSFRASHVEQHSPVFMAVLEPSGNLLRGTVRGLQSVFFPAFHTKWLSSYLLHSTFSQGSPPLNTTVLSYICMCLLKGGIFLISYVYWVCIQVNGTVLMALSLGCVCGICVVHNCSALLAAPVLQCELQSCEAVFFFFLFFCLSGFIRFKAWLNAVSFTTQLQVAFETTALKRPSAPTERKAISLYYTGSHYSCLL